MWTDIAGSQKIMQTVGIKKYSDFIKFYFDKLSEYTNKYDLNIISELGDGVGLMPENPENVDGLLNFHISLNKDLRGKYTECSKAGIDYGEYIDTDIQIGKNKKKLIIGAIVGAYRLESLCNDLDTCLLASNDAYQKIANIKLRKILKYKNGGYKIKEKYFKEVYMISQNYAERLVRKSLKSG